MLEPQPAEGLIIRALRKTYGGQEVLKGVDLSLGAGQVHALLGPNGAGKSTLLGCLSGAVVPDGGEMVIRGEVHRSFTPASAFDAGTAIIYQHFQLIGQLSIADNMFLGNESVHPWGMTNFRRHRERAGEMLESLGISLDPDRLVEELSVGEQQIVEIARAILKDPSVLILDEPTAALSEGEVTLLLDLVRRLAHEHGITIIYVTHLLREVLEVADTVTIIRDGNVLWTRGIDGLGLADLVHAIAPAARLDAAARLAPKGGTVLQLSDFRSSWTGPVDLAIAGGEIVAVFGLLGSGRTDLLEGIAGVRRSSGRLELKGEAVRITSPAAGRRHGIGFVASDRKEQSLFSELAAQENLLVPHYPALSNPLRSKRREAAIFERTANLIGLIPPDPDKDAATLSGGNAQKLVVGRWMTGIDETSVLILDEPTQGVDVGARQDLYDLFRRYAEADGHVVLFSSSDPDEVIALADRVLVLVDGAPVAIVDSAVGEEELLTMAHGSP